MNRTIESYELEASALAAAITHTANKDVRYYLNGVYLDFPKGRIVATDSSRLFCGKINSADCEPVIIPRDMALDAIKAAKKVKGISILILNVSLDPNKATDPRRLELITPGSRFSAAEVDGKYVSYERVIPLSPSGEVGNYSPYYLLDAEKALATFSNMPYKGICHSKTWHNGNGAALVTQAGIDALCAIVPVRLDGSLDLAWFTGKAESQEAA